VLINIKSIHFFFFSSMRCCFLTIFSLSRLAAALPPATDSFFLSSIFKIFRFLSFSAGKF